MPGWAKISVCNWLTVMENHDFVMESHGKVNENESSWAVATLKNSLHIFIESFKGDQRGSCHEHS